MTASRVVNRRLEEVRPETRERVEEAIAALGYRPNYNGRGLRLSRSLAIGMLILDPLPTFLADPFTTQLVAGLSNYLSEQGYSLNIQGVTPRKIRQALLLRINRTDGLCVFCSGSLTFRRRVLKMLELDGAPTVLFQETLPAPSDDFCVVRQDDFSGGALLARHLFERGARRIAFVVPPSQWPAILERKRGIESYLRSLAETVRLDIVTCRSSRFDDVREELTRCLRSKRRPDALLTGNGQIGIAAMKLLAARGLRVPQDIMVAGFHGFEYRYYSDPVLTTIRSPAYELGVRGGEEMIRRLTHGAFSAREIVLPIGFEPGEST